MSPDLKLPLVGAVLLAGCEERPDPPTTEALAACEDEQMGDSGFDWSCCDVWIQECMANGDDGCEWICNG